MPENLKRFAHGRSGGLRAAIIVCSILLGLFGLALLCELVTNPYESHTFKMALFFCAMAALSGLIWAILVRGRYEAQTKFICNLYGEQRLALIDSEVLAGGAYYKGLGIELTQSSLLSHGAGLVIVPMDDIQNITCHTGGNKARLVLRSRNGSETMLPRFKLTAAARAELHALTGWMATRIPDLTTGTMNTPANGAPCDQTAGFFAADTTAGIQMQPEIAGPSGASMKPNYGKGTLGALLGAVLGGTAWGLIGLAGYTSGWIGLLVVVLSMYGFKQVAGRLDKNAAWICLGVSLVMLLPANYLVYSASVADALAEYYYVTTFDVIPVLLETLAEIDMAGRFWMDYCVGAGLTFIFGLIEVAQLSPKKNSKLYGMAAPAPNGVAVELDANGQPVSHAVTADAPVNPNAVYEVRYPARGGKAASVIVLVFGVLMLVGGVIGAIAALADEEVAAAIAVFLIFGGLGALYLWLAYYTRRRQKNVCIRYNDKAITFTKVNGSSFTCAWPQVTELRLGAGAIAWNGAYTINTPYGKIVFNAQMPGWDHLREYARTYAINAQQH